MSAQHTPGPWSINLDNQACTQIDGLFHAVCTVQFCFAPEAEKEANARLIAAAPDGLELAEDAIPILEAVLEDREMVNGEECEILRDLLDRTKAFVSKARGEA